MLYGVDVHDGYQKGLSFPLLARQGYSFAAVKLTQGVDYARDLGDDWVRASRDAGLIPGAYHWITRTDGATQARWFYKKILESGGPTGMLIQLDCEADATYQDVLNWKAEWNRLSNNHPFLLYTGKWWWDARNWNGPNVTPYLWDSHYISADTDTIQDDPATFAAKIPASYFNPGYGSWTSNSILQFTSRGDAGSLGNNVDLNVTRMTREQLVALTGTTVDVGAKGTDIMISRVAMVRVRVDGVLPPADKPNSFYVGDGIFYTNAVTWNQVTDAQAEGAKTKTYTEDDDWKGWVGRNLAGATSAPVTATITQDQLNAAVLANVPAIAAALASHIKVV